MSELIFKMADENKEKRSRNKNPFPIQEKRLAEQVRLYPAIYDKSDTCHKERDIILNAFFFSHFLFFFTAGFFHGI